MDCSTRNKYKKQITGVMYKNYYGAESGGIRGLSSSTFCILLLVIASLCSQSLLAAEKNTPAPDFSLPTQDSDSLSLSSLKGNAVLVNFWASWCKPCREEIPELIDIYDRYRHQGLRLVGINIDAEKNNADRFINHFQINYTIVFDPQMGTIEKYKARGMPSSFIIDKKGMIREIVYGFSKEKKQFIESRIAELIAE